MKITLKNKKQYAKLVLIAGGISSGKTHFSKKLKEILEKHPLVSVNIINMDDYFFEHSEVKKWKNMKSYEIDWLTPEAINFRLLKNDLFKLLDGQQVKKNHYDFQSMKYDGETMIFKPAKLVILEGILALHDDEIVNAASLKVYVQAPSDVRRRREFNKQREERHPEWTEEQINSKWKTDLEDHKKYISPQKKKANIILKSPYDVKLKDRTIAVSKLHSKIVSTSKKSK